MQSGVYRDPVSVIPPGKDYTGGGQIIVHPCQACSQSGKFPRTGRLAEAMVVGVYADCTALMNVGTTRIRIMRRIPRLNSLLTLLVNLSLRRGNMTACWMMSIAGLPSSTTVMAANVAMAGARISVSLTRLAAK